MHNDLKAYELLFDFHWMSWLRFVACLFLAPSVNCPQFRLDSGSQTSQCLITVCRGDWDGVNHRTKASRSQPNGCSKKLSRHERESAQVAKENILSAYQWVVSIKSNPLNGLSLHNVNLRLRHLKTFHQRSNLKSKYECFFLFWISQWVLFHKWSSS